MSGFDIKGVLKTLAAGDPLDAATSYALVGSFVASNDESSSERVSEAQIGAALLGLSLHVPTAEELSGAARALRELMTPLPIAPELAEQAVDTCGTGGSGKSCFNTSTSAAFVVAAAGVPVAKHGNRAATSSCGSADVLEALGFRLEAPPDVTARALEQARFCFMFAPSYHAATKRVQLIRRELGLRTVFNFLGPLVSPARVSRQLLGVSDPRALRPMAEALRALGTSRALVVHGEDGVDELSIASPSRACSLDGGRISELTVSPEDAGLERRSIENLPPLRPPEAASLVRALLAGEASPYRDVVALNAGAALHVAGAAGSLRDGTAAAIDVLRSGAALRVLEHAAELSRR